MNVNNIHNCFIRTTLELSRVLAVIMCLSVRLSQVGVLPKRLNIWSRKQRHTIARESNFLVLKISAKFERGHPNGGVKCRSGSLNTVAVAENWRLSTRSVVNLARSHVYHTQRPPSFAGCSALRGFVIDSWYLMTPSKVPDFHSLVEQLLWKPSVNAPVAFGAK